MVYNVTRLGELLVEAWEDANLPADGITISISSDGTIEWSPAATQQHKDIAVAVIASYTELSADALAIVKRRSIRQARAATILATITIPQATSWVNSNITTPLATLKTQVQGQPNSPTKTAFLALIDILEKQDTFDRAAAQLAIALRNNVFPELQEG